MKSPPIDDNGMVNGYLVYRRRKKRTSSEAIYLNSEACKGKVDDHVHMQEHAAEKDRVSVEHHEDVTVKPKSSKTSSADKPNASAEFDKTEAGNKGVATVSNPGICGDIKQHTLNNTKVDKLLMLSEACIGSMGALHNSNKDTATMKQPYPVNSVKNQTKKEKYAKLRERQKEKVALRNKGKEPLSSPRPVTKLKHNSDLQMVEYDEMIALNALNSWKGANTPYLSSMVLSGQDKTNPNSLAHLKNGSASGFTTRHENIDTATASRRPSEYLKLKGKMDGGWSELELDVLWVAVRRHGQGNWEAILADPNIMLLKNKTPQELATRWIEESQKIFPSAVPLLPATNNNTVHHLTPPERPTLALLPGTDGYSCNDTTAVQCPTPITRVPPHVSSSAGPGTQRLSPLGVENQSLRKNKRSMTSQNNGIEGSSTRPRASNSHSVHRITSVHHGAASNGRLNPNVSGLMLQTLNNQMGRNMMSMSMQELLATVEAVSINRQHSSSLTNAEAEAEPKLLLGGHFQLPKIVAQIRSAGNGSGSNWSNPILIEDMDDSSHRT